MWFCYFLIVVTLCGSVRSEDFYIDHKACLLSSKDNSIIIDLSSAQAHEELEGYLVVTSLCQRNKKQKNCPKNSLVCVIDQERNRTIDAGSQVTKITPSGPKAFEVEIESKFGKGTLTVWCREDISNAAPLINDFKTDTPFTYSIMWMCAAACPQKVYSATNSCILYTKDVSYDLRPLQDAEDFIVPLDDGGHFVIGICRNAHEAQCLSAVCRRSADGIVSIAQAQDLQLNHIHGRGLELVYINTIGNEQTVIKFECSEKTTEPVISFVEEYNGNYFFTMATDIVCPPPIMDCLIFDDKEEYQYDLSPLYRLTDNWEIVNKNVGRRIIFNLCGPLNYIPHMPCTGKNMFACIFDEQTKAETFGNKVVIKIVSPGNVSLNITGPTNFSLNIVLECSYHENHPYMNDSYGNTLFWKTVTACPSKVTKGSDCKAVNLYSNTSVDLTPLRKLNEDYLVNVGEESFRINICGNLIEKCSQTVEASVCYKNKEGKELAIGQTGSKELVFKDGQFMFYMEGEPCNENATKSEIHIILKCEYFENSQGHEVSYSDLEYFDKVNACEFHFLWRTNYVCKERSTTANCSFQKGNKLYDLSSLRNLKDNYSIQLNKSLVAVLNVCHSVIPGHRIRCHARAGACLLSGHPEYILSKNYQERKTYETLGLVSNSGNFDYVNGSLRLSYVGGVCKDLDHGSQFTTIIFFCNESELNTEPIFKGQEKCEYRFEWTTRAACPRYLGGTTPSLISTVTEAITTDSITKLKPVESVQSCSVTDPKSNKRFDLTVLMSKPWTITDKNITIGICRPIKNSLCSENSGACSFLREGGSINIGDYNTDLIYEEDSLYLQYKTPDHITKIEFVCSKVDLGPKFIGERITRDGLVSFISWPTHLACDKETELNCCKGINKLCDYYNGTYEVPIDDKQSAFLSLCRPVIPKMGLLCTNNTPACIGVHKSDHSFSDEKILGKILKKPLLHKSNKSVVLEYISGSLCDSSNELYSTHIRFFCNQNGPENYPIFHHIENYCKYVFDWGSPLLCDEKLPERKINCTLFGKTYAIEALKVDKLVGVRGEYILNFCKLSSECRGQVCKKPSGDRTWHDFSVKNTTVIGHEDGNSRIIINYLGIEETNKCGATVEILCDAKHSTFSDSSLIQETDCFIHVLLKHKLACSFPLQSKDMSTPQEGSYTLVWCGLLALTLILAIIFGLYWYRKRKPEISRSVNRILRYTKDQDTESLEL